MSNERLEHSLSSAFPKMRRISELVTNIIALLVVGVLFWLDFHFGWPIWAIWILIGLLVFSVLGTVYSLFEPTFLYRSWSYQYDEEYLQLRYGIWKKIWVTVPMTKIQSVSTVQGPIMKRFQTRSIRVETMGSSHAIPALDEGVALQLREVLSKYAKLKEEDES